MPQPDDHPFYRAVLKLYPKAHRREYGEQMVQTLDDLIGGGQSTFERLGIWATIALELPINLAEEHINNLREINMSDIKPTSKKLTLALSAAGVIAVVLLLSIFRPKLYQPTTLSKVPRSATPPACVQGSDDSNLSVEASDKTFIASTVAASIIDVPAGTNVDVNLRSYNSTNAAGTAIYPGTYGRYNFEAKKIASNNKNSYDGGWKITHFESCKG